MHNNPLVSVIIPCYNAEKWVADAINGILRQTYAPIEIIVIDDGSTDGSLDVIRSFEDRVRYETGPNRGGNVARNRGFALSRGEYVMFHDADDWISEDTIAKLVEGIKGTENTLAVCDWYISFPAAGGARNNRPGNLTGKTPPSPDPLLNWFEGWRPCLHAILWPRHVILDIDGWDESLKASQDLDIYSRALIHGAKVKKVQDASAYYRQDNKQSVHHQPVTSKIHSEVEHVRKMDRELTHKDKIHLYRVPLARLYNKKAYTAAFFNKELSLQCERRARELAGFRAYSDGPLLHRVLSYVLSYSRKEKLAQRLAKIGLARKARKDALKRQYSEKTSESAQ